MSKAKKLIDLVDEGVYDDPLRIVDMIITKMRSLAKLFKINTEPDLDKIKARLDSYIINKGVCPIMGKPHPDCIFTHYESVGRFKIQYNELMQTYKTLLLRAKVSNPWLDVNVLLEPLARIRMKDK